jgi:nitrate/TMAO reductase-like tetraheme cytochrome c subunit
LSENRPKKRFIKPLAWVAVGIIVAFPLFSMTYFTMVRTSTPEFCSLCHEILPAVDAWRTSSHVVNEKGFVADCMDCHLPAPQDMFQFFYAKSWHGIKDVAAHFAGKPYDRQAMRELAWASIDNQQCQKCHRNLLYMPHKRGAMLAHRSVLYPRPGYEKKCLDCHRPLVHKPKPLYSYAGRS